MISPARLAAYLTLRTIHSSQVDLGTVVDRQRRSLKDDRDRSLAAEIIYGTLRRRAELDQCIAWAGHRPVSAFDPEVLDLLRLSVYQLLHLDRVPDSAVVDEAVNLCKCEGKSSASGAVNAILRNISRNRLRIPMPGRDHPLEYIATTLSHPAWLADRWISRLGFDAACEWAAFNNAPSPMTLRANRLKTTRDALAHDLATAGVSVEPTRFAPDGLIVKHGNPLRTTIGQSGHFLVQDESSQLVALFAGVRTGERILDACAAPGGKTSQMAADAGTGSGIVACDLRPRRMRLLERTLHDMGASGVRLVCADLTAGTPFKPVFDCVLVDAPCSGLGTVRRDPDIKWRRAEADLPGFADRQAQILDSAAAGVRPGGRLIYSTCSSEPDENEAVVERFLSSHDQFVADPVQDVRSTLAPAVQQCVDSSGFLHPTPHQHGLEPFFAARLRRNR